MKLRIRGNSLRLRLTQAEVAAFAENGVAEESTEMAGGLFRYAVVRSAEHQKIHAAFDGGAITVFVPEQLASHWARTDSVGIQERQAIADGGSLDVLIEKDFACLDKRAGDEDADTFPNPKAAAGSAHK